MFFFTENKIINSNDRMAFGKENWDHITCDKTCRSGYKDIHILTITIEEIKDKTKIDALNPGDYKEKRINAKSKIIRINNSM